MSSYFVLMFLLFGLVLFAIGLNLLIFKKNSPIFKLLYQRESIYEMAEKIGPTLSPFLPEGKKLEISQKLEYANYPMGLDTQSFFGLQFITTVSSIVLGLFLVSIGMPSFILIVSVAIGFFFPVGKLNGIVEKRQDEIRKDLPHMVGLLATSVRAGVELGMAFEVIAKNIPGVLGDELRRTMKEISTGSQRAKAMKDLGRRSGVDILERFLETVVTAEERGGMNISDVLEDFTDDVRAARKLDMEAKVNKLPTKMLLPIFTCVFIPMLLMLLTPVIFIFMTTM